MTHAEPLDAGQNRLRFVPADQRLATFARQPHPENAAEIEGGDDNRVPGLMNGQPPPQWSGQAMMIGAKGRMEVVERQRPAVLTGLRASGANCGGTIGPRLAERQFAERREVGTGQFLAEVLSQDRRQCRSIRALDVNCAIESTGPNDGRVEPLCVVGGGEHGDDPAAADVVPYGHTSHSRGAPTL